MSQHNFFTETIHGEKNHSSIITLACWESRQPRSYTDAV